MLVTFFVTATLVFYIGVFYGYWIQEVKVPEYECNFTLVV